MGASLAASNELRTRYSTECARIREEFPLNGDGAAAVRARTDLVDSMCARLWRDIVSAYEDGPEHFALVAIGGYGRRALFPFSDVDILFLHEGGWSESEHRDKIRRFSQEMWDLGLRLSPATRTLAECDRFDPKNTEFSISLLDCRYLAGDRAVFDTLRNRTVPRLVMREYQTLVEKLSEVTRTRYAKFGNTVFHLEPNVKDGPGGLRDYNIVGWLALISAMDRMKNWPDAKALLPAHVRAQFEPAHDFMVTVRCFLHYRHNRDDNTLNWESQDEAAKKKIGMESAEPIATADWMRMFFRHARTVHDLARQLLEEIPAARSSLYRQFQSWRTRVSNSDFSVVDGVIFLQQPAALQDFDFVLRMFQFQAHHGLRLSASTSRRLEQVLPSLAAAPPQGGGLWRRLREILAEPHAAEALRTMHSLRLLTLILPELDTIDALVIRDFYHRFTVDEHSILAIESLLRLPNANSGWDGTFGELLQELEQPELLYLSLLLHDTGKGVPSDNHVRGSLEIAERCLARLDLETADRETVLFLIGSHLEISAALRRDVFDPATVRTFAEKMGTQERLKMLTLMTLADIKAVNPEALTPWKAENIWQLYIAASNYLNRSADQQIQPAQENEAAERIRVLAPALGKRLKEFLDGLPARYLRMHAAKDVLKHIEMAGQLGQDPFQIGLERKRQWYELTVITKDRPALFATIAGVLAAWGMNIVKADAFSNRAGVVVDTFSFADTFRTLELNLPEWHRFHQNLADVLRGGVSLEKLLSDRKRPSAGAAKVRVETQLEFDDVCSAHSTLLQIVTQDRTGLLHRIATQLAAESCNIEIALIDTEGQMAIDVFYLTSGGAKLPAAKQGHLRKQLLKSLQPEPAPGKA